MAILGIDHVAIAVRSIEDSQESFTSLLQMDADHEVVEQQGVKLAVFELGDSRLELLEPLSDDNSIARFLDNRGEGVHHVALRTDSVQQELDRISSGDDLTCLDSEPRSGAQGYRIAFLHPDDLSGTLIELAQPAGFN
ncbi:MAG: methylmalonyl-CoA epimerase [bacterium]